MELFRNISTEATVFAFSSTVNPGYLLYLPLPLVPFVKYLIILSCVLGFFIGSCGNVLVIFAISSNKNLKITPNSFLASLAVADFFTCSIVLPLITVGFASLEIITTNPFLCRLFYLSSVTFSSVSIQHLILIAGSRYILVTKDRSVYLKTFNKHTVTSAITLIWTFNLSLNIAVSVTSFGTERFYGKDFCYFEENNLLGKVHKSITSLVTFLSCFVIVPTLYVTIFRRVRKSRLRIAEHYGRTRLAVSETPAPSSVSQSVVRQTSDSNGNNQRHLFCPLSSYEIRLTKVNFFVFLTNVFFLSPVFFFILIRGRELLHGELLVILFLVAMNSVTNPLIYCCFNKHFRKVFKQILRF